MPRSTAELIALVWKIAALTVAYVVTAKLGLKFDALAGVATTVWPPSGVALAAMVMGGRRFAPGVFLGAFLVNATTGIPIWAAAVIAAGNTLEALAAAELLRRWRFQRQMDRVQDVLVLGLVSLSATMVSATVGLAAVALAGVPIPDGHATFWLVWWVGDVLGVLLVAPVILCWVGDPHPSRDPWRWLESALLVGALVLVGLAVFHDVFPARLVILLRGTYSMWPLLIWAALRFRQRGTAAALLLVSVLAISGTAAGQGVFATETLHERLFRVQCYMAITAVSMMTLAAALAERRQAIHARDEFISIASHELKTPLTALKLRLGSAVRLAATAPTAASTTDAAHAAPTPDRPQKLRQALGAAETITDRLARLIDDLLDVSRLTARRLVLDLEQVATGALLREVVGRLREQVAEAGSPISLDVAKEADETVGVWDRVRIEQVLTNMVSNAVKYGAGKPIAVWARAEGERILIAVKDQGIGIAKDDQARIFHAFERVHSTSRVGGLGLGLYIGLRIAEAHGGGLSVESAPGQGATFVLDLPRQVPQKIGAVPGGA